MNELIKSEIVRMDSRIRYVDIDTPYDGHRFCERGSHDDRTAFGEDDPKIWINTLWEDFKEDHWIPNDDINPASERMWAEVAQEFTHNLNGTTLQKRDYTKPLHVNSVFHPKEQGHKKTSLAIAAELKRFADAKGLRLWYA